MRTDSAMYARLCDQYEDIICRNRAMNAGWRPTPLV